MMRMKSDELLRDIRNNSFSGASELMSMGIECLSAFSDEYQEEYPQKFYERMLNLGKELIDAQPSMAPLFNAVNTVLLEIEKSQEKGGSVIELKEIVMLTSKNLLVHSKKALMGIQKHSIALIENGLTILTHSYSSTVIKSLIFAHKQGKDIEVIVTESRPLFEGRRTAKILSKSGIKVTLIADMASFYFLDDVDMILTGSDCICYNGVVNKMGTKGLAIAASYDKIPFYVLSEKSKFFPKRYLDEPRIEEKEPKEVLEETMDVNVRNIYFDLTPYEFLKGIITEDGILGKEEIKSTLTELKVCANLFIK